MLLRVQIDLSDADVALFDQYEEGVLALLPDYGANLIERIRSIDGRTETHLLEFPDADALARFRADPRRAGLQDLWVRCGASAVATEVQRPT